MATLSVESIPAYGGGLEPTFAAATEGGDEFANDGRTYFLVQNGDASTHAVTITGVAGARTFNVAPTQSVTVDADDGTNNGFAIFGPFDPAAFNDSDGNVQVTYDSVHAALKVAAVKTTRTPVA